jgi:hypothetical protein
VNGRQVRNWSVAALGCGTLGSAIHRGTNRTSWGQLSLLLAGTVPIDDARQVNDANRIR